MKETRIPSDLAARFEMGSFVCTPLTREKYRTVAERHLDAEWPPGDLVDSFMLMRESFMWRLIGYVLGVKG